MAIVALVLWLFTAGAGITMLVRSNLGGASPSPVLQEQAAAQTSSVTASPVTASPVTASAAQASPVTASPVTASPVAAPPPAPASATAADQPPSKAEIRQATRTRFDPESLVTSRSAPIVPGPRALLEFMHPACAIVGLGFWLGFTLVHPRFLGWIAVGLITVTACLGLVWFATNNRAARRQQRHTGARDTDEPAPSFNGRLVAVHGAAATITFVLAVLSVLVLKG